MEQVTRHSDDFRFHLPHIGKDIGMQWIGPRKLGIHLNVQSKRSLLALARSESCTHLTNKWHSGNIIGHINKVTQS